MRPRVLKSQTPEFRKFLASILARRGGDSAGVDRAVSKIIADVRKRGNRALIELTTKFDGVKLTPDTLRVTPAERHSATNRIAAEDRRADGLGDQIRREHSGANGGAGAKPLHVNRQERDDDAEAEHVNEDGQKDDEQRAFVH